MSLCVWMQMDQFASTAKGCQYVGADWRLKTIT